MQCAECGFDELDWEPRDAERLVRQRASWLAELGTGPRFDALDMPAATTVHDVTHRLWQAGRLRWAGTAVQAGTVAQLSVGSGGVPKGPVERAHCGRRGLAGDRQATRRHHGAPPQALCLWSAEVVDALAAEGHPIGYGSAGENVTVRGLDWGAVAPGQRLRVGPVVAELTAWAIPCRQNARWFTGGDFRRILAPAWSRVYARVLSPGPVAVGDPVEIGG